MKKVLIINVLVLTGFFVKAQDMRTVVVQGDKTVSVPAGKAIITPTDKVVKPVENSSATNATVVTKVAGADARHLANTTTTETQGSVTTITVYMDKKTVPAKAENKTTSVKN